MVKRERDDDDLNTRESKRQELDAVNLMDFPPDLLRDVIPKYLNADDLMSLSSVSKELNRLARAKYFESRVWEITPEILVNDAFTPIAFHVTKVVLSNDMTLNHLKDLIQKCPHITHLTFGARFNQDVRGALPQGLTHLTFRDNFDQDIQGALPKGLTHLTFGYSFNQDIQKALPKGLTHLTFGAYFNQDIRGALPEGLTHLTFGYFFNQDIGGALPNGLTHLTFGWNFRLDVRGALPESVHHVTVSRDYIYRNELRDYAYQHSIQLHQR
jgi:hypothetical protein